MAQIAYVERLQLVPATSRLRVANVALMIGRFGGEKGCRMGGPSASFVAMEADTVVLGVSRFVHRSRQQLTT